MLYFFNNNLMKNLSLVIKVREFIVSNFGIKIYSIIYGKNNNYIFINSIFRYSLFFFPFSIFNYFIFPVKLVYKKNNI